MDIIATKRRIIRMFDRHCAYCLNDLHDEPVNLTGIVGRYDQFGEVNMLPVCIGCDLQFPAAEFTGIPDISAIAAFQLSRAEMAKRIGHG